MLPANNPQVIVCYFHGRSGYEVFKVASPEELKRILERRPFKIQKLIIEPIKYLHEMTPAMFVIESGHWDLLPILVRQGDDLNRRQQGIKWLRNHPDKNLYRSALDYFFVYVMDEIWKNRNAALRLPQYRCLREIDSLLIYGLDVHKIQPDYVFEQLSESLMRNLMNNYNQDDPYFPEIRSDVAPLLNELRAIDSLFRHGYSEFTWMKYYDSAFNWVGVLIQLVTHPRINKFCLEREHEPLPDLLQTAARLLIDFLFQCHFQPETLRNYSTRVGNRLQFFRHNPTVANRQMERLMDECTFMQKSPPSLCILARNQIRKCLGGIDFQKKVATLDLPKWLEDFVISIGPHHMEWIGAPPSLASLARGRLKPSQIIDVSDLQNGGEFLNAPPVDF